MISQSSKKATLLSICFTTVSCLAYFRPWKWRRHAPPKRLVDFQRTIRRYIPEDRTLDNHRCENIKSYKGNLICICNARIYAVLCINFKENFIWTGVLAAVTLYSLVDIYLVSDNDVTSFLPANIGNIFLRNFSKYFLHYMGSYPRKQLTSNFIDFVRNRSTYKIHTLHKALISLMSVNIMCNIFLYGEYLTVF
jgi:hypothetical protein